MSEHVEIRYVLLPEKTGNSLPFTRDPSHVVRTLDGFHNFLDFLYLHVGLWNVVSINAKVITTNKTIINNAFGGLTGTDVKAIEEAIKNES